MLPGFSRSGVSLPSASSLKRQQSPSRVLRWKRQSSPGTLCRPPPRRQSLPTEQYMLLSSARSSSSFPPAGSRV